LDEEKPVMESCRNFVFMLCSNLYVDTIIKEEKEELPDLLVSLPVPSGVVSPIANFRWPRAL